jgi:uncharacterized protein
MLFAGATVDHWQAQELESVIKELKPAPETIAAEIEAYQGSWLEQMGQRVPAAIELETGTFLFWAAWRVGGLMLLGMALFKLGVLSAERSGRFYGILIAIAVIIGIPVTIYGMHYNFSIDWEAPRFFFHGLQFNYWASIPTALGWIGIVMLLCRSPLLGLTKRALSAVGRTALSNYILQTIICTTIFYGHGLGMFGRVDRSGQALMVAAIWAFQIIASCLWLRYFSFGPLEWIWRTLVYMRVQPLRRPTDGTGAG